MVGSGHGAGCELFIPRPFLQVVCHLLGHCESVPEGGSIPYACIVTASTTQLVIILAGQILLFCLCKSPFPLIYRPQHLGVESFAVKPPRFVVDSQTHDVQLIAPGSFSHRIDFSLDNIVLKQKLLELFNFTF